MGFTKSQMVDFVWCSIKYDFILPQDFVNECE